MTAEEVPPQEEPQDPVVGESFARFFDDGQFPVEVLSRPTSAGSLHKLGSSADRRSQ